MRNHRAASPAVFRTLRRVIGAALVVLLLLSAGDVALAAPFDELLNSLQPDGDVNDVAGALSPDERAALENRCRGLRERTGAQLAVVVLQSLEGGEVDDFTEKLFKRWGVGKSGEDNGVMLLVALDDRKARIEVGCGLEPVLPDALAGRILREQLFPRFREQRHYDGLSAAVDRIIEIVDGNQPAPENVVNNPGAPVGAVGIVAIIAMLLMGGSMYSAGAWLRNGEMVRSLFSLRIPMVVMVLSRVFQFPQAVFWLMMAVGLVAALIGFLLSWLPFGGDHRRSSRRWWDWDSHSGGSSWSGGGFGGGFSGGGGGSWGGFGGGRSGGGGASGGW